MRPKHRTPGPALQPVPGRAMIQVAAVGFGFAGALLLAGIVFLAINRGGEAEAIWIFPLWAVLFVMLIWGVSLLRQVVVRGLALLGAGFLALPLAWLVYQGLPSLDPAGPAARQTLSVFILGLVAGGAFLAGSVAVARRGARAAPATAARRTLVAAAAVAFAGEAVYAVLLLLRLFAG